VGETVIGKPIVPGEATGTVLRSDLAISLWGGVDPQTGTIIDPHHDRCGESIVGRVFVFPGEKGSSTGSAVLLELARRGLAPAALVSTSLAPVAALGSIVAEELYGTTIPVIVVSQEEADGLADGERLAVSVGGTVRRLRDRAS
jgi:predicted aconitase with swiveling domain